MTRRRRRTGEGGSGGSRFRLQLSTANLPGTLFIVILMVCACMFLLSKGLSSLKRAYTEEAEAGPIHGTPALQSFRGPADHRGAPTTTRPLNDQVTPAGDRDAKIPLGPEPMTDATPARTSKATTDYILLPSQSQP